MKGLLFDNWTLENVAFNCSHDDAEFSNELIALIEAIVLWDEIFYFDNGRTYWQKEFCNNGYSRFVDYIKPIKVEDRSIYLANAEKKYIEHYSESYTPVVAQGALEFLDLAKDLELSYMPFEKRAEFVKENLLANENNLYNRNNLFSGLEKDALEYYTSLNSIINDANISIQPNILFSYISNKCASVDDLFFSALELKEHHHVKEFKKWIEEFERELLNMDLTSITKLLSYIKKLQREITEVSGKYSFNTTASLGLSLPGPQFSIGVSLDLLKSTFLNVPANLVFPMFIYGKSIGKWQWSIDDVSLRNS